MKQPFQVAIAPNQEMKAWDLAVQIGGFKTKQEAEHVAKLLAEFIEGESGWSARVQ